MMIGTMAYNGRDIRVSKTDSGGAKTFKRAGVGVLSAVLSDGAASYSPGISEKRGGASTFYSGGIKNTDTQTDATQTVSARRLYDAFGNVIASTGTWKSPFGNAGKFGYQEDPDTGLKLLGHRYYDSSTGRFLTRDPARDGRNWFGYCHNSPVGQIDADGLKRKLAIILGKTENLAITHLITWLKDQYEADYDIVIVDGSNPQVVEDALVDADAAIMIGHGAPFVCRKKGTITPSTLARVASRRKALGKGKLDFLRIYSCNALTDKEDLDAYLSIAHHVFGYKTLCWFSSGDADTNDGGKWYNDGESDQTGVFDVETPWSPRRTATWGGGSRRHPVAVGF